MHIVKRPFFTLLEMLVVLFIISFGVILTGVKLKEMYREQRFLSQSQQVLSHLAMAQDLMLIMDSDVQFKIKRDPESKQCICWLEVDKPFDEAWARFIERKIELSAIQSFEFEDRSANELSLLFSLGRMSQGTLSLFQETTGDPNFANNNRFQIELLGHPRPFTAKQNSPKEENKLEKSRLLYPSDVYEQLYADASQQNQNP